MGCDNKQKLMAMMLSFKDSSLYQELRSDSIYAIGMLDHINRPAHFSDETTFNICAHQCLFILTLEQTKQRLRMLSLWISDSTIKNRIDEYLVEVTKLESEYQYMNQREYVAEDAMTAVMSANKLATVLQCNLPYLMITKVFDLNEAGEPVTKNEEAAVRAREPSVVERIKACGAITKACDESYSKRDLGRYAKFGLLALGISAALSFGLVCVLSGGVVPAVAALAALSGKAICGLAATQIFACGVGISIAESRRNKLATLSNLLAGPNAKIKKAMRDLCAEKKYQFFIQHTLAEGDTKSANRHMLGGIQPPLPTLA